MTGSLESTAEKAIPPLLRVRRLGIHTHDEAVIFIRQESYLCRSEGFSAHARVRLTHKNRSLIATLYQVTSDIITLDEVGLSDSAWIRLDLAEGDHISISHPEPLASISMVRGKIYGQRLDTAMCEAIVADVVRGDYSDIHLSAFLTSCAARPLDHDEMIALTNAMLRAGEKLTWKASPIVDKHCVGGLPGNRTTPIVVAIAASWGLIMPKISSRAITSPAGTADMMETLAPVDLTISDMRKVIEKEGGCVVWGRSAKLSPADDIFIGIERLLDLDGESQLAASILSKKLAAGTTHLLVDIPYGPTAKIRSAASANLLSQSLVAVANSFGLHVQTMFTDGSQPVGRGIGPALEARDVLAVLQLKKEAPADLRDRSLKLAGALLELGNAAVPGNGVKLATDILDSGKAWAKFQAICEAQGGMREPPSSSCRHPITSKVTGRVYTIDNRGLAKIAKLAGAPDAKAAGVELAVQVGDLVKVGEPLYTIQSQTPGELNYARAFAEANAQIYVIVET